MNRSKILVLIIFICVLFNFNYLDTVSGWLIFLSQFLICCGILLCYNRIHDIFSPIIITYVGMLIPFSIKGMYILETEKFPESELILPLIYYNIFIYFFTLAVFIKNKNINVNYYIMLSKRKIDTSRLVYTSLFLAFVGLVVYIIKMGTISPSELVLNVLANRIGMQNSGGLYIQTLVLLLLQTALFVSAIVLFKSNKIKYLVLMLFLLFINFMVTFTLGGRGMIIVPILILFFYKYKITGRSDWIRISIFFVVFLIFSGWYGMYRDGITADNNTIILSDVIGNVLDRYVQFDNFIRVVSNPIDYHFGQSFIDFLSSPIPRSIFPDKPYNFNSQMTQIYHPEQAARFLVTDFTMLSELLLNFGLGGLIIGSFFFGRIISYFNYAYNYFNTNEFFLFWYPFFMLKPMSYLYGGLINSTVNMMVLLELPILILLWIIYSRRKIND